MCVTAIAYFVHPKYPFVLLFNRDEVFERPVSEIAEWTDEWEGIVAGRDLMAGGTWLGMNHDGKFVAVTNFRDSNTQTEQQKVPSIAVELDNRGAFLSRGLIPLQILRKNVNIVGELENLWEERSRYRSFNLLAGDVKGSGLYYFSVNQTENAFNGLKQLEQGLHCMSNTDISNNWKRTTTLKDELDCFLKNHEEFSPLDLLPLLTPELASNEPTQRAVSVFYKSNPINIGEKTISFGTVSSTIITVSISNEVNILERTWSRDQLSYADTSKSFYIST
ncbi:unnamed protein product [Blepharisma stoltei]|uniref:NRDE family protein n=1 Tax=Blepharisma stoltei TaxID=1481888 RepID=A0AAU9IUP9_9CILI|nr:unnamed protein product [Blepharisma stoltei]